MANQATGATKSDIGKRAIVNGYVGVGLVAKVTGRTVEVDFTYGRVVTDQDKIFILGNNMTTTETSFIDTTTVQTFLDNIGGSPFTVTFLKKDGTERKVTGMLDTTKNKRSENVPVMDLETGSWKSFNVNRVLWMESL